jgi:threonine dehydrogenase-like Zn-dependent dehydrogenase
LPAGTSIGYNNRTGGAWGECFVAHESQLVAVPEDVSDEQAVLVDPVACSLHGVLRVDLSRVGRVAVVGLGVLGLATVASLRAAGFDGQIDGLDAAETLGARAVRMGADGFVPLPPDRRGQYEAVARRVGATVHRARFGNLMLSGGYDAVFDCAGSAGALEACLKWAAARGQVALVGTAGRVTADLTPVWFRELELVGVYGRAVERIGEREIPTYQLVLDWMAGGRLDVRDLLTHTYALGEYRRALDVAMHKARHNALKVALDMRAESPAGAPVGTR